VSPWLGAVRPFVIESGAEFRADGPPALESAQYAEDFDEARRMGGVVSERTTAQTATGIFHTIPPFRFWSSITRNAAVDHGLSAIENARMQLLVWVSTFDASVACFESKYHYFAWRPYTAIVDPVYDDGNPATVPDPSWQSLAPTPPHPEYPSAHACTAGGVMVPLEHYFGTKKLGIRALGTTVANAPTPAVERYYATSTDLVQEIVDARVYGGMHFRTANVHGVALGKRVARAVLRRGFGEK
jgi:hypothetical protein